MPTGIEEYALLGDMHSAALVGRNGSIDWLCLPRFDSAACLAALLGDDEHGTWRMAPVRGPRTATRRRYREGTLVLETEWDTPTGTLRIVDFMPLRENTTGSVMRIVEGVRGAVDVHMDLCLRFDYGRIAPWVREDGQEVEAVAGPEAVRISSPVEMRHDGLRLQADFAVRAGDRLPFALAWRPSHEPVPEARDPFSALEATERFWTEWSARCGYSGEHHEAVLRSLITLKALTYAPTGGIVAAPTTSLPESLGGTRNWDYRYCWLRDAAITLEALLCGGFVEEAAEWRSWLLRAVAGNPQELQIMYGVAGERRLLEWEAHWLPGFEKSAPVRIGNAAADQLQLDVYGEVLDAFHLAVEHGLELESHSDTLIAKLLDTLAGRWQEPDEGVWEVRGSRRQFVFSKVMAWVAFDRAVRLAENHGFSGPVEQWRSLRDEIHREILAQGFDPERNTFTQYYGSEALDASLLLIPAVGFLPPTDARVVGTIEAVQRELTLDGFVCRYRTDATSSDTVDGLAGEEGTFIACTFWLANALRLIGREQESRELFERMLSLRNDVGLLAEEYDPRTRRQVGNFPQAFSHVPLVSLAFHLARHEDGDKKIIAGV